VNRINVIQSWLNRLLQPTYLEIGVCWGFSFAPIRADQKIGVDPRMRMPGPLKRISRYNARQVRYFEETSDRFFAEHANSMQTTGVDVALIDGLHTYEQSFVDLENVLKYLNRDGLIVLHDCNPKNAAIGRSVSSYEDFRNAHPLRFLWSGDVWKTIVRIRSTRRDLRALVLNCDFGLGLVRRAPAEALLDYSLEDIRQMSFSDMARERQRILNLKEPSYFYSHWLPSVSAPIGHGEAVVPD
jgi:Methyltransferase domain